MDLQRALCLIMMSEMSQQVRIEILIATAFIQIDSSHGKIPTCLNESAW